MNENIFFPLAITSFQNPKIKEIIKLKNRRERDQKKLFLIEGYRELLRAFEGDFTIDSLFFCEELFLKDNEKSLIEKLEKRGVSLFSVSKRVFEKISYRDRPDGLMAIAPHFTYPLNCLDILFKEKKDPLIVIAESIEKPGNLGSILRSSDGVGADAVIVSDPKTDIFNPNVVRSSVGTLFTQKVLTASSEEVFFYLKEKKCQILAATPHAQKVYTDIDLTKKPIAIAVGTEQYGLSEIFMKKADLAVRIPMMGVSDSLNVATATTLLLYEVLRQKNAHPTL